MAGAAGAVLGDDAEDVRAISERLKSPKEKEKVDALFDAAKLMGTAPVLRLIPPYFAYANAYVSDRAIAAFSEAKHPDAFQAVARECLQQGDERIRRGALEALARTRLAFSTDLLNVIYNDTDEEVKLLAAEVLQRHPPARAPAELIKWASPAQKNSRLRAQALIALGGIDAAAASPLATAAMNDKDAIVRVGGLLAQRAAKAAPDVAVSSLADPDRRVRLAALEWIRADRPAAALPRLVQNLGREAGRLREETLKTLKNLSLRDFGYDAAAWNKWLEEAGSNFVPPPLPSQGKDKNNKKPAREDAPQYETWVDAPRYYDFIVQSDRVAFLVDVSGSMRAKYSAPGSTSAGSGGEKTRLEHAAQALRDVIRKLPKGTKTTVIVFNNAPLFYRKGPKGGSDAFDATPQLADDVYKFVISIGASQSTNISDSLELVIDNADVDTVYLLTDGAPSAGKRNLSSRIVAWATRLARLSRTEINTIGFGASDRSADFLRDLAEATGGRFDSR
jgi:hypothetical protein